MDKTLLSLLKPSPVQQKMQNSHAIKKERERNTRRMSERVLGELEVDGAGEQKHMLLVWSGHEG